jgi:hypothetical protein
MSNALGPVVSNRLAGVNKAMPKPHLRERLAQQSSRNTPQGTLTTDAQGRQSFVPNYLLNAWGRIEADPRPMPRCVFQPGQQVCVDVSAVELLAQEVFPFDPEDARPLAGCEGVVIEERQCTSLGLVLVRLNGEPWAFMPAYLRRVTPAEGDDEREAMASGPAFDPYGEPLALGDTVQCMDGRIGRVTLVEPQRMGMVFECGSAWCGPTYRRSSFRLLAKAAPTVAAWSSANGCPL